MSYVFEGLKPERFWKIFYDFNQIPRESKHEEAAAAWLVDFAKNLGLPVRQDEVGNVLVTKPATPGYENAPKICMQGHMDMVCEKNKDVDHDFRKDPIKMKVEKGFVTAEGTTLGADNGVGVAAALLVMESKDLVHPPMEFLFTIDEETGLTGANALKPGFVTADILLNGDSEEDGVLFVGCAGGKDTHITREIEKVDAPKGKKAYRFYIEGFKGGHSGLDIHKMRANAIVQLNRVFAALNEKFDVNLYKFDGGTKHNAIPREAECFFLANEKDIEAIQAQVAECETVINTEYKLTENKATLAVEPVSDHPSKVFSEDFTLLFTKLIAGIPHGVMQMSAAMPGVVETSTNLAIVHADENLEILTSQRSFSETKKNEISAKVRAVAELAGCKAEHHGGYPGWDPNPESKILKVMSSVYEDLFGKKPETAAIHAGLECGIIGETRPGMDMISYGPDLHDPHSPSESVNIKTVENFWNVTMETLKRVAEEGK
jgi:dipeptidase D